MGPFLYSEREYILSNIRRDPTWTEPVRIVYHDRMTTPTTPRPGAGEAPAEKFDVHQWVVEHEQKVTQKYIDQGDRVAASGRCDRYPCDSPAMVEDRHPSDRGCGVVLCAHHFCERNGLR